MAGVAGGRTSFLAAEGHASLAEKLNHVFFPFEVESLETASFHPPAHSTHTLLVKERRVHHTLWAVNPRKVPSMSSDLCRLPSFRSSGA